MSAKDPGIVVGARVKIPSKGLEGTVHFVGATKFSAGEWVGIELDVPEGKHNGTLRGVKYFECPKLHGMFAKISQVKPVSSSSPTRPTTKAKSSSSPKKIVKKKTPSEDATDTKEPTTAKVSTPVKTAAAPAKTATTPAKTIAASNAEPMSKPATEAKEPMTPAKVAPSGTASGAEIKAMTLEVNKIKAQAAADQRKIKALQDSLELAELDKQVAAEHIRDLKEQLSDAKIELEGGAGVPVQATPSGDDTSDLAAENVKLKNAVIRLRDAYAFAQADLESARHTLKTTSGASSLPSNSGGDYADDSVVEALSDKNVELEAERSELELRVNELMDLLAMNDKVTEAATLAEKEASAELTDAYNEIMDMEAVIASLESKNSDYRKAVTKLKTKLSDAQKEVIAAQRAAPVAADLENSANDVTPGMESVATSASVVTFSNKERAQAINQLLYNYERKEAASHLKMLELFLPDTFAASEQNGILFVLFLNRLRAKCEIILEDTRRDFRLDEDLATLLAPATSGGVTLDQLSFAQHLVGCLSSVMVAVTTLLKGLERGDDNVYRSLSHSYVEIKGHEAAFDTLLELIKTNGLGPTVSLDKVRAAAKQFDQLIAQHVSDGNDTTSKEFSEDFFNLTPIYVTSLSLELSRLQDMYSRTTSEGEKDPAFDNLIARLGEWIEECDGLKKSCRKAAKFAASTGDGKELAFPAVVRGQLCTTLATLRSVAEGVRDTGKAVYTHTHSSATLRALQLDSAFKIAQKQLIDLTETGSATQAARDAGAEAHMVPHHVPAFMAATGATLTELVEGLERGKFDRAIKSASATGAPVVPPWEARGVQLKGDIAESLSYKAKLEDKVKEVAEAKKLTAAKERHISEMKVKLAASIKLADTVKHEESRTSTSLKKKLDELELTLQKERSDFEKERIALEDEIRETDAERDALKKKYELDKPATMAAVGDLRAAGLQIYALREALRTLRVELSSVRGQQAQQSLKALAVLPVERVQSQTSLAKDKAQVAGLLRDLKMATVTPVMVDITKAAPQATASAGGVARANVVRANAASLVSTQAARMHALRTRGQGVVNKAQDALGQGRYGARASASFGAFATPEFKRALDEGRSGTKTALISMPTSLAAGTSSGGTFRVALDTNQFKAIHAEFVR